MLPKCIAAVVIAFSFFVCSAHAAQGEIRYGRLSFDLPQGYGHPFSEAAFQGARIQAWQMRQGDSWDKPGRFTIPASDFYAELAHKPPLPAGENLMTAGHTTESDNEDVVLIYENGIFKEKKKRTDLPIIQRTFPVEKRDKQGNFISENIPIAKISSIYIGIDGNRTTYENVVKTHVTLYSEDGEILQRLILEKNSKDCDTQE